ncbi:P-type DNA transfer protein VirB5 [Yersinia aldovae]|uniref:type IV secretion system protein n=1 Tax=Yersinia aldovae TaxID=29483 RepID=UPI0005E61C70|nr:type IV secretion system protein [Yersinia aldovae]CNK25749.1 P-type DNA transfer protein VirB5 [Yersinia aldovae]
MSSLKSVFRINYILYYPFVYIFVRVKVIIYSALFICSLSSSVQSAGIPVVDVAGIAQMLQNATQQAQEALDNLDAIKSQIAETKSMADAAKARFEGNWGLADVLNDPTLNSYLPTKDWSDIYGGTRDLTNLRDKYGLKSQNTSIQKHYDEMLTNLDVMQEAYDSTVKRSDNIRKLGTMMDTAQTPQQKADYANRIAVEQTEILNENTKIELVKTQMEQRAKAQEQSRRQAWIDEFRSK